MQVPRRVGLVQPEDVLEPAGELPADGRAPASALRRLRARALQPARHEAHPGELALPEGAQGGLRVSRGVARLLRAERRDGVARHRRATLR